jgi:hypothetical protein
MRPIEARVGLHEDGCRTVLVSEAHNASFCGRSTARAAHSRITKLAGRTQHMVLSAASEFIHGVVSSGRAAELLDSLSPCAVHANLLMKMFGRARVGFAATSGAVVMGEVGCVPLGRWQRTRRVAHASDECAIEQKARIVFPKCNAFDRGRNVTDHYAFPRHPVPVAEWSQHTVVRGRCPRALMMHRRRESMFPSCDGHSQPSLLAHTMVQVLCHHREQVLQPGRSLR